MEPQELARLRTEADGIPRYVTKDGRVMKCDWCLPPEALEDNLEGEALEEHIRQLTEEQWK